MSSITKRVKFVCRQELLFEGQSWPTWERIKSRLDAGPRGTKAALARYLAISPASVGNMLTADSQPAYGRVRDVMAFIASNGL